MIKRLNYARGPIAATLAKLRAEKKSPPRDMTDGEWEMLEEFEKILDPIRLATVLLQHQQTPTVGIVSPILVNLVSFHLDTTLEAELRNAQLLEHGLTVLPATPLERFKIEAGDYISRKLKELTGGWHSELVISTMLDPRVKDFSFVMNVTQRQQLLERAKVLISEELKSLSTIAPPSISMEDDCFRPIDASHSELFDDNIAELYGMFGARSVSPQNDGEKEMQMYLRDECMPILKDNRLTNPLKWWLVNQGRYPLLSKLAKKYLVMITNNAGVERMFSLAGWIVDKRRCNLTDDSVESRLMFVANKTHLM